MSERCLFVHPGPRTQLEGLDEGATHEKLGSVGCSNEFKAAKIIIIIRLFTTEKAESRIDSSAADKLPAKADLMTELIKCPSSCLAKA